MNDYKLFSNKIIVPIMFLIFNGGIKINWFKSKNNNNKNKLKYYVNK